MSHLTAAEGDNMQRHASMLTNMERDTVKKYMYMKVIIRLNYDCIYISPFIQRLNNIVIVTHMTT